MSQNELKNLIDDVVDELQFRIYEGIIDLNKSSHQSILSEILHQKGLQELYKPIKSILIEAGETPEQNPKNNPKDEKFKHVGGVAYVHISDYDESTGKGKEGAQHFKKTETGDYVPMSEDEYNKGKQDQGEKGGSNNNPGNQEKPENGGGEENGNEEAEKERQDNIKKTYSDSDYQKRISDEAKAAKEADEEDNPNKKAPKAQSVRVEPREGKLSDIDDKHGDGKIKQKALETGYREVRGFKPAPGNSGSMLSEIMSGEVYFHLDNNPDMSDSDIAEAIYDQVKDTRLGRENGDYTKDITADGAYRGFNKNLMMKCESIARSGKVKWNRTQQGIGNLAEDGLFVGDTQTRNFYGHSISIEKQIALLSSTDGPFYTRESVRIEKEDLLDLIRQSGGGNNPSDTSTITMDSKGTVMVEFHSDKLTTNDIQANSTPNKESENAIELVDKLEGISGLDKEQTLQTLRDGQNRLKKKEEELKFAGAEPARVIKDLPMDKVMNRVNRGKNSKYMKKQLNSVLFKHRKPHPYLTDYLEPLDNEDDEYTNEQLLKAFLDSYADSENTNPPTGAQVQFMNYLGERYGVNISEVLSNIRMDSIEIQRDTLKKLNERSITLPNGDTKPMGDYIEAKNIIDKFHLDVIDGTKGQGVSKYNGLYNVNMGGVIVEPKQLKKCFNIEDTNDFIHSFEVGNPSDGDTVTKNTSTGSITGRNVYVYALTKKGKRIPIGYQTSRSKQGQTGSLTTTYQYHPEIQKCFKKNQ